MYSKRLPVAYVQPGIWIRSWTSHASCERPRYSAAMEERHIPELQRIANFAPLLVITGAGISTGSGLPTYRDERGNWVRSDPITHQQFLSESRQRQRYWGRSTRAGPAVRDAPPTRAHRALAAIEAQGHMSHLVTQNVDRLHQRAGSERVTDLHGRLDRVRCLQCDDVSARSTVQERLLELNPWLRRPVSASRPDGDADLAEHEVDLVRVPQCERCSGTLMPDVVFFGGSIPSARIEKCKTTLAASAALLVVGSSLQVYSGYRLCRWAKRDGKPVFIINPGSTRADALADVRIPLDADTAIDTLADVLGSRQSHTVAEPL